METKKNPNAEVKRNSSIYFAIGLALMLAIANYSINYRTYDKSTIDIGQLSMDELNEEEVPITAHPQTPPPPPPPPPVAPEDFEVADDDDDIEETIIDTSEIDEDTEIVDVDDVVVDDFIEDIEVPFHVIEHVPSFPGCERGTNEEKRQCMSKKINRFVQRKFNTNLAENLGISGRQRIDVIFKIDKSGNVTDVRSRAPHPRLQQEAARVINLLPKMKPGVQRGKAVIVSYSLPIIFQVQN